MLLGICRHAAQGQPGGEAPSRSQRWYDKVKVEAFVDAYSSWNFNFPKPQFGTNLGRSFDVANGFSLNWAGFNVSYAPDPAGSPVGGFIGLRFGPGAYVYNGLALSQGVPVAPPEVSVGAGTIKEAYASWKPLAKLQVDLGKFNSWIGSEVTDSQYNMNYTRSALFFTQPYFHTGLRLDFPLADTFDVKLFLVNGYNNTFDNNIAKTFGVALAWVPISDMAFFLNYIGGPEYSDTTLTTSTQSVNMATTTSITTIPHADSSWRHLVDAVVDLHFGKARALANADYGIDQMPGAPRHSWWFGANVALGYSANNLWSFALRGGYLDDPDGYLAPSFGAPAGASASIFDVTATAAVLPTQNLIVKLEPRLDAVASDGFGFGETSGYPKGAPKNGQPQDYAKTQWTIVLGVVATTN